jgi:hypothetical protein
MHMFRQYYPAVDPKGVACFDRTNRMSQYIDMANK